MNIHIINHKIIWVAFEQPYTGCLKECPAHSLSHPGLFFSKGPSIKDVCTRGRGCQKQTPVHRGRLKANVYLSTFGHDWNKFFWRSWRDLKKAQTKPKFWQKSKVFLQKTGQSRKFAENFSLSLTSSLISHLNSSFAIDI